MADLKIDRINELYHKSKAEGLTQEELKEQALLRQEYIASVKGSLLSQINNIDVVNPDGSIKPLSDFRKKKD